MASSRPPNNRRLRPQALTKIANKPSLRHFHDFTERFRYWQQLFAAALPTISATQARVLKVQGSQLKIATRSAAWAKHIQQHEHAIITHFNEDATFAVQRIEVVVAPDLFQHLQQLLGAEPEPLRQPNQPAAATPSDAVAKLRQQAQHCDEPLRSQLLALADHYSKA